LFLKQPPRPRMAGGGQGRASGPGETSEAARPAEPLRRRASMRDQSLSPWFHGVCIDLYSSPNEQTQRLKGVEPTKQRGPGAGYPRFARARAEDEQRWTARRGWMNPDAHRQKGGRPEAALSLGRKRPRRAYTGVNPHRSNLILRCNNCKNVSAVIVGAIRRQSFTQAPIRSVIDQGPL
jgi:hypothetical protein